MDGVRNEGEGVLNASEWTYHGSPEPAAVIKGSSRIEVIKEISVKKS